MAEPWTDEDVARMKRWVAEGVHAMADAIVTVEVLRERAREAERRVLLLEAQHVATLNEWAAAILTEREACAKIAELAGYGCCECTDNHAGEDIAAAIRAGRGA